MVLYKGAEGAQCAPVPIWDISEWTHPGGGDIKRTEGADGNSMCGTIRFNWLNKAGSHSSQGVNPESGTSLSGGATKVGEYVDTSSGCSSS